MGIFDEVRENQPPTKPQLAPSGLIWVTMLIEYDTTGKAVLLRSFSRPAKDSDIKFATKSKPKEVSTKIVPSETSSEEALF